MGPIFGERSRVNLSPVPIYMCREANKRAADVIFTQRNADVGSLQIDLHYLQVAEACEKLNEKLDFHRARTCGGVSAFYGDAMKWQR